MKTKHVQQVEKQQNIFEYLQHKYTKLNKFN